MAAAKIGNPSSALQFLYHTIQGGQPALNQVVHVAWAKELGDGAEHTLSLVTPGNAFTCAERSTHLWFVLKCSKGIFEAPNHINRAVFICEYHRLLRRQSETPGCLVVVQVSRGRLMGQPFP